MSKIPKKIPAWIESFSAFAKTKERKKDTQNSIDVFSSVIKSRWDEFVEQQKAGQEEKNSQKKPRTTDPVKNLGKAMKKVGDVIEDAKDNTVLLDNIRDQMKNSVPENVKPILSEIIGNSENYNDDAMSTSVHIQGQEHGHRSTEESEKVKDLLSETSKNLKELANVNKRVYRFVEPMGNDSMSEDIGEATRVMGQVTDHINQLKETFDM